MSAVTPVRRDRLRQHVGVELRAALISGDLEPGSVHSAPALAARFGVSATPVREAMLDLARDGMVEVVPNTGFRITAVSAAELDALAEVRLLLEVPTMGAIAEAMDGESRARLEELRPVVDTMRAAESTNDMVAYLTADTEFHTRFLALHGNAELVNIVRRARERSRLHGLLPLAQNGRLTDSTEEHAQLIDLATRGDRQGIETLMRAHIGHVRQEWSSTSQA